MESDKKIPKGQLDLSELVSSLATKLNAADYNDRYKGKYTSLGALETAHPSGNSGDYAQVDAGSGTNVINYNYDEEEGWVIGSSSGSGATTTDELPEGSSNLYFTTARVLATVLTGISFATGGAIVSTDSVLIAFGKIQKQLTDGFTTANIKSILGITTLSGNNTGDETAATIGALIGGAGDATPNDTDFIATSLTAGGILKKITWTNAKAFLKTYFDAQYQSKTSQKNVTGNITLDDTYKDCIVKIKANSTITIPSTLSTDFSAVFRTYLSCTATFVYGSGTVEDAPKGKILSATKMATLFRDGSTTTFVLEGELTP